MSARSKAETGSGIRRSLAKKLLSLRVKHAKIFADMDSIKATLIDLVTKDGKGSTREVFPELGTVTVAPAKDRECRGNIPEVNIENFNALPESRRAKLVDDGVISVVEDWSRPFRGSVAVKTF